MVVGVVLAVAVKAIILIQPAFVSEWIWKNKYGILRVRKQRCINTKLRGFQHLNWQILHSKVVTMWENVEEDVMV